MQRSSGRQVSRFAGYRSGPTRSVSWSPRSSCRGASSSPRLWPSRAAHRRAATVLARQQRVVQRQLLVDAGRLRQAGDAQHLLHAEPQRLAVLEDERQRRADALPAVAVEVTLLGGEEFAPPAGELVERQEIVGRQRLHPRLLFTCAPAAG